MQRLELMKIGIVPYLNAYPLVRGLEEEFPNARVVSVSPARLAESLRRGEMDLALVSSIFVCQHPEFVRVGDICIASKGPIRSVRLFHNPPLNEVRRVGLDTASRTSIVLGRIILERHLHLLPEYVGFDEAEGFPAPGMDGAVVIGDRSFEFADRGISSLDLGEAWREYTGLPFVFAFWTGRGDRDWEDVGRRLGQVRDRNLADTDALSRDASNGWGLPVEFCREYLTQNVHYTFGPDEAEGLERFFTEAKPFLARS